METPTEEQALAWLETMQTFCVELQKFVENEVCLEECIQKYAKCPADVEQANKYRCLWAVCKEHPRYMSGIPRLKSMQVRRKLEETVKMGNQTLSVINSHPVFGIFQGDPETRVEAFFEQPLCTCISLGTEYGLYHHQLTYSRDLEYHAPVGCID